MSHTYLLSWDCYGLEACINVSEIEKRRVWDELRSTEDNPVAGRDPSVGSIVNTIMLRARFNHQRHYEIYAIDTEDDVDEQTLRSMFEADPQGSADLIRARGRELYSDRASPNDKIKIR